jgi:hypothetical protein
MQRPTSAGRLSTSWRKEKKGKNEVRNWAVGSPMRARVSYKVRPKGDSLGFLEGSHTGFLIFTIIKLVLMKN